MLILNKEMQLYFEWEMIIQIIDALAANIDILVQKKRIESVAEMYKVIKNLII
jgi:hypothetical protein